MAVKQIELPTVGIIKLYKRHGSRSIRLTVAQDGSVRVSMPYYVPYQAGLQFVKSRLEWIANERSRSQQLLKHGDKIGKAHHLQLTPSAAASRVSSRINGSVVQVTYPFDNTPASQAVQVVAKRASLRALKNEAQSLLPQRLDVLARNGGFSYRKLSFKQLKSRWGSCNSRQEITLNIFLMQLPWELIDYVLYHELSHTKVLHHGPEFWRELEQHVPKAKQLRKVIRSHQPVIAG